MQSNPFRVFTRALCSIYRQSFIEIRGGHLGRFPRKSYYQVVYQKTQLVILFIYEWDAYLSSNYIVQ